MDRAGKILLIVVFVVVACVIAFKYKQFYLDKDFSFSTLVSCDPATEHCFKAACDGACDTWSGTIFSDGSPYKYVTRPARDVPKCLTDTTCPNFICPADSKSCVVTYCSEDVLQEGEECVAQPEASSSAAVSSTTEETVSTEQY